VQLKKSLAALQTSYLDILYVHYWDYTTSIPEMMQSLNDVVRSGSVHYLGISDTPAWIVAAANDYAAAHGMAQFVIYQGKWNLGERDMEREIIPMCQHYKMGIGELAHSRVSKLTGQLRGASSPRAASRQPTPARRGT
jgi:aryl-alcohol dehydrogenase-like predicted oxidoreductase